MTTPKIAADGLRERLVWMKLAGTKTVNGYLFRTNEAAAVAAVAIVAEWLRDEETSDLVATATERHSIVFDHVDADGNSPCACGEWSESMDGPGWDQHMAHVGLKALADLVAASVDSRS
jgi:hypothetical protein